MNVRDKYNKFSHIMSKLPMEVKYSKFINGMWDLDNSTLYQDIAYYYYLIGSRDDYVEYTQTEVCVIASSSHFKLSIDTHSDIITKIRQIKINHIKNNIYNVQR